MIVLRAGDTPLDYACRVEEAYAKVTSLSYFTFHVAPWIKSHQTSREIPETNGRRWWFTTQEEEARC